MHPGIWQNRDLIGTVIEPGLLNTGGGKYGGCNWTDRKLAKKQQTFVTEIPSKKAAEEKKRQELAKKAAEEKKRQELAKKAAEEKKRRELAKKTAEERNAGS